MLKHVFAAFAVAALVVASAAAQSDAKKSFVPGAKIYIGRMTEGFDDAFKKALQDKKVPVSVVPTKDLADFEVTGSSDSQKAGAAKKIIMGSWHSDEQASISVADLKSGEVVFAYSVNKKDSAHGKRSTAEACAVHIKDELEKNAGAK